MLTPDGAVSPRVKYSGPGAAEDSRLCLVDLCRLRFEEEEDIEDFNCTLPSLLGLSPNGVWLGAWVWCGIPLLLDSGFLLVPWCRSDPGIPHAGVGTSPVTGPRWSRQFIHSLTVAAPSPKSISVTKQKQDKKIHKNKHTRPLTFSPPRSQFIPLRSPTWFVTAEKNAKVVFQCCKVCTLSQSVNEKDPNQTLEHCGVVSRLNLASTAS